MSNAVSSQGLSRAEVAERVAQGLVNRVKRSDFAEYLDIFVRNTLTLFNALVVPAAVILFLLEDYKAGVGVSGFALVNTVLGLIQEIRAKWQLDRLTLLSESRVRVVREGQTEEVPSGDVVQGDHILLAAGDPVVADGKVLEAQYLEIDEALLTGESDPVPRKPNDELLSGSFCVAGQGVYSADRVGVEAFAHKTASEARSYEYTASPLQENIDRLIRILSAVAVVLSVSYIGLYNLQGNIEYNDLIRMIAATITSMVPQGLVLMATVALLLGAVHMTARRALINRLAAVEAMASIDTLCMDKTGTLTTNQLKLAQLTVLAKDLDDEAVRHRLRLFASVSLDQTSKSLIALQHALGKSEGELVDQLPFKSQNRYSAVRVRAGKEEFVLVLGAREALLPFVQEDAPPGHSAPATPGLRQLFFAEAASPPQKKFEGSLEGFTLRPLALIGLSDEIRPEAGAVLRHLAGQGISFKILSGDNPETVKETVSHLGEGASEPALQALAKADVLTGAQLEQASEPVPLIEKTCIFGRVSPWQKVQIVRTLTGQGHQVAMIGDGVNDVLPIKNATLGIAMGDGSRATKTVAGVVLETNDFGLLPELLDEGRMIVRNLRRAGKLFLNKNVYVLVMIVGALGLFGLPFPFAPQQVTLLNALTIGVPALLITLDRTKAGRSRSNLVREIGSFVLVTGMVTGSVALALMLHARASWDAGDQLLRTLVLSLAVFLGWVTLWRALLHGEEGPAGGTRLLWAVPGFMLPLYLLSMYVPAVAEFFELVPLDVGQWGTVLAAAVAAGMMLGAWDLLERRWQPASAPPVAERAPSA